MSKKLSVAASCFHSELSHGCVESSCHTANAWFRATRRSCVNSSSGGGSSIHAFCKRLKIAVDVGQDDSHDDMVAKIASARIYFWR